MKYQLPNLPFSYDALEPWIDEETMHFHHDKHHQTYVDKLNTALEKYSIPETSVEDLLKNFASFNFDEADRTAIKNNAGGHANHSFFWEVLNPNNKLNTNLIERIEKTFGTIEKFKELFSSTALNQFGSGWAWLVENESGELEIYSTSNQDSPYSKNHKPLITIDVWEHAYYLKYKNMRADYIKAFWNICKPLLLNQAEGK